MKRIISLILISLFMAALSGCTAITDSSMPEGESGTHSAAPLWVGKIFSYSWETDATLSLLLAWIDSGGAMEFRGQ